MGCWCGCLSGAKSIIMFPWVIIFYCFLRRPLSRGGPWATAQFAPLLKSGPAPGLNLPFPQILPFLVLRQDWLHGLPRLLPVLFTISGFIFCSFLKLYFLVPCGRLSWLNVDFWTHVTISHRKKGKGSPYSNTDRIGSGADPGSWQSSCRWCES